MALTDEAVCRGRTSSGPADLEAFTATRWVIIRGDIAPYPF